MRPVASESIAERMGVYPQARPITRGHDLTAFRHFAHVLRDRA
jgi:hypothetical protein